MSAEVDSVSIQATSKPAPQGMRKNGTLRHARRSRITDAFLGKQWHEPKKAFRPKAGNSSWEKRSAERQAMAAVKAKEKEMKDEKEADRLVNPSSISMIAIIDTLRPNRKHSRISEKEKRRRRGSRRWQRPCTGRESSD